MTDARQSGWLAGPGIMLISAAIFGYFGFFTGLTAQTAAGNTVFFFALLLWTLRVTAIAFVVSAALTAVQPLAGNLIYSVFGILSAVGLVVVGVMDLADAQHAAAIPPLLAFLFAAWNGYGSWTGLRAVMAIAAAKRAEERPGQWP
jgi:hypothetical protein